MGLRVALQQEVLQVIGTVCVGGEGKSKEVIG